MPKKGHTEEQIIAALKQHESGEKTTDICRKLGISQATFYLWKRQYVGLGVQELREMRQQGGEQPAQAIGCRSLAGPADPAGDRLKKAVKPRQRCRLARWAKEAYQIPERRAARLLQVAWSTMRYRKRKGLQEPLRRRLRELAATHVRYGYRRLTVLLRREGWKINAKRVYRLYDEENLKVRSVERKKIARRQRVPQGQAVRPNDCWSADFVSDKLSDGRSIRILTVVDQFTRECVWLEADRSMNGNKVVAALTRAINERGRAPRSITLDNGSEFVGRAMEAWAIQSGVQLCFIRPGRPVENGLLKALMAGSVTNA